MKTKLTISVDEELVKFAHAQARIEKRSVSRMFSDFLIASRLQAKRQSIVRAADMIGSLQNYRIDDSKAAIRSTYAKKHLH